MGTLCHICLYIQYVYTHRQTKKWIPQCLVLFPFDKTVSFPCLLVCLSASDWPTAVWQDYGSDREWEERGSQAGVWWISCGREGPLRTPHHLFWGQRPHAHRQGGGSSSFQFTANRLVQWSVIILIQSNWCLSRSTKGVRGIGHIDIIGLIRPPLIPCYWPILLCLCAPAMPLPQPGAYDDRLYVF